MSLKLKRKIEKTNSVQQAVVEYVATYTAMLGQQWLFSDQLTALVRSEILHLPFDDGASAKLCPNSCTLALVLQYTILVQRTGWIIQSKSNRSLLFKLSYWGHSITMQSKFYPILTTYPPCAIVHYQCSARNG